MSDKIDGRSIPGEAMPGEAIRLHAQPPHLRQVQAGAEEGKGSTGDQIGGQSRYAEDEANGKVEGLPRA